MLQKEITRLKAKLQDFLILPQNRVNWEEVKEVTNISIAEDNWLALGLKAKLQSGVTSTHLSDLVSSNHTWNISALRNTLQPDSAIHAIQTRISWTNPNDSLFWPHTPDGLYTVKSGYKMLLK